MARVLANGELEYLGRMDHQVKIRGNRVELGEIERQMMLLDGVDGVLVMARDDEAGGNYLCAYLKMTPNGETALNITGIRETLAGKLPDYMVPSYFILIEEFPVTATGKVDRRKLPLPEGRRPELGAAYEAPGTEIQRSIASVWKEILTVDNVGIHDNFFDLGGTSLAVVRLNARLNEVLAKDIPIVTLFEYPTIHGLTRHLAQDAANEPQKDYGDQLKQGRNKMKARRQRLN